MANPDPKHVAIIMDGNGRWAHQRNLARIEGHRQGIETVRRIVEAAQTTQIEYLTLYAFSVENWRRPDTEIRGLMELLTFFLNREIKKLTENQIRFRTIGDTTTLPSQVQEALQRTKEKTAHFEGRNLVLALNYGARSEWARACQRYFQAHPREPEASAEVTYEKLAAYLDTGGLPDPDLLIRTSGEYRLSNFLLLQAAYAELYFTEVLWPDFSAEDFHHALTWYRGRERRFGLTAEQTQQAAAAQG